MKDVSQLSPATSKHDQTLLALSDAEQSAKHEFDTEELNAPVASCPLLKDKLYVAPARYALAESPAEHINFEPAYKANSHPQALRMLREGYLYLWQDQDKAGLRRFAINKQGLLLEQELNEPHNKEQSNQGEPGVTLAHHLSVFLVFTEIPLLAEHYEALQKSASKRKQHMRAFSLAALQGYSVDDPPPVAHCLPAKASLVAELMPQAQAQAAAIDYRENGDKYRADVNRLGERMMENNTPSTTAAYIHTRKWLSQLEHHHSQHPDAEPPGLWSATPWNLQTTQTWLEKINIQAQQQDVQPWLLAVDDLLGDFRDINHEQGLVEAEHEQWQEEHSHRTVIGGFIRSLIQEDGGEIAQRLNYQFREHNIEITPEQGDTLLDAQRKLLSLIDEETINGQSRGVRYDHAKADQIGKEIQEKIKKVLAPVHEFVPKHLDGQTRAVVREYSKEKVKHMSDGLLDTQVAERVRLDEMNDWLDVTAPAHYERVNQHHQLLYADRAYLNAEHGKAMWYVDYEAALHTEWLSELAWNTLSAACARPEGITQISNMLRALDPHLPLTLLASGWQPELGQLVSDASRAGELKAVFTANNAEAITIALKKMLPEPVLQRMKQLGSDATGNWNNTVTQLAAGFIELKKEFADTLSGVAYRPLGGASPAMASLMLILFQGDAARFEHTIKNGQSYWRVLGTNAEKINQYVQNTVNSLRAGSTQTAQQVSVLGRYGGVLPLAILGLNILNSLNKAGESFEGQSEQRQADQISAYLYTSAALLSVMQGAVIAGYGEEVTYRRVAINFTYAFTGLVGLISAGAAYQELQSISAQISRAESAVDPYLKMRQQVVTGQVAAYFTQGLLGAWAFVARANGRTAVTQIASRFKVGNLWLILLQVSLGSAYAYFLLKQGTPLQNFLSDSCWGKRNQWKGDVDGEQLALIALLFSPTVAVKKDWLTAVNDKVTSAGSVGGVLIGIPTIKKKPVTTFEELTINLPGATPENIIAKVQILAQGTRNLTPVWVKSMQASWIPHKEGQGLRLSSICEGLTTPLYVQVDYQNPMLGLFSEQQIVGGKKGLCYRLNTNGEATLLTKNEFPPSLNSVKEITINSSYIKMDIA